MGSMDIILLTLLNVAICVAFPKFLSLFLVSRAKPQDWDFETEILVDSQSSTAKTEISSFPYCTTHPLTGNQFCKFSPTFCPKCST
jgi:hypothetical protein